MGRELQRIGAPFRQPEWSALALIEAPAKVAQVHASFAAAGAQILTTNSYALVPFHLGAERFAELGRFNMGSTVILLLPAGACELDSGLTRGAAVRMGQSRGRRR